MPTDDIACFHCDGRGEVWAHLNYGTAQPGAWHWIRCQLCDGTGVVSKAHKAAYDEGRHRRKLRVAACVSQHEMAKRLGVTFSAYSRMEQGDESWPEGSLTQFLALKE